jgi:hypothetical protein
LYDPSVKDGGEGLVVRKPSKVSPLISDRSLVGQGLFATRNIENNTIICDFNPYSNDCMIDLSKVLFATTTEQSYEALVACREAYYNYAEVVKRVNACPMITSDNRYVLVSSRFIAKGEEIYRVYGFSTWLKELPETNVLNCITARAVLDYIVKVCNFVPR